MMDDEIRPGLPRPNCRVVLVCGPPGAGKSTYVQAHAADDDCIIDLDAIAKEYGFGRNRPRDQLEFLLGERNRRLAALAAAPPHQIAWVILSAPSSLLRQWWADSLAVKPEDLIVLAPSLAELHRRIDADPDRRGVVTEHLAVVKRWFELERCNDPGSITFGCDENGTPVDPLHPWNVTAARSPSTSA
jgi:AAA domain-containing protein